MFKFLSVILLAAVTVSPTFAMTKHMPQQHGLLSNANHNANHTVKAQNLDHTKRTELLDPTHAPQAATQPMQPSRGMFNNPNEFRTPLIAVLTEMKRLGGGKLPVPNLGRFIGGGNTKMDDQITPEQLANKLFKIEPKAGNKCMLSIHQDDKYWHALLNDLRGDRGQNSAYMEQIQKLRELQSKLVVYK